MMTRAFGSYDFCRRKERGVDKRVLAPITPEEDESMIEKTGSFRVCCLLAVTLVFAVSGSRVWGSAIELSDLNTTIQVDSQSDAGLGSWTVNGVNQLNREWFWFRVGDASPTNPEQSIDTLPCTVKATDANFNPGLDTLNQQFVQNGQFSVLLTYTLIGGELGTSNSDLILSIKIVNTSAQSLNFHFFQLADFSLGGSAGQDTVQAGKNLSGLYNEVLQQNGNWSADAAISPGANLVQVDSHPNVYGLLTNSQGDDLNGALGPVGPGNVQWGLQWNATLAPTTGNLIISEDQNLVVPEPATVTLLVIGALGLLRKRRN
jgi:hypothetical protein